MAQKCNRDCAAFADPATGSCLAADRAVNTADAYFRVCRAGVDACLLVTLERDNAGVWQISTVTEYGGPTENQIVP